MRDYSKVEPKMWHGKTMKALRKSPEGLVVALYLMTSPSSNMLGLYAQPILYVAYETGLGEEGARKGLQSCIDAGFCSYDEESEFVFVHEMACYQIAPELKAADLRCKGIQKDYEALPDNPFLGAFYERYADVFHLTKARGIEAPSKPLRSQEQEQEQEQDRETREVSRSPSKAKKEERTNTLKTFLDGCKANGVKPIPDDHPIRQYMADSGISEEMAQIAWLRFREEHTVGARKSKRYTDWPATFANSVKDRWYRLWFVKPEGEAEWTSEGLQAKRAIEAAMAAKMQQEAA
ncbi:hypothetical protein N5C12_09890 [Comamonas aquatica]|uniref:hypothetical protein n=1 Tax=Comamonas aquatica TaxID=225991 RepID=UPI0024477CD3|nr:hypothetical protein [Comamonas aquatica]MDH0899661.1 hypothetical protein [Comamonas aquatica]